MCASAITCYAAELLVASPNAAARFMDWPGAAEKPSPALLIFCAEEELEAEAEADLAHPHHSILLLGPEVNNEPLEEYKRYEKKNDEEEKK